MEGDIYNYTCSDVGLLLPAINEFTWSIGVRATLYLAGMLWCFLAVAIIADIFMCSIERITSKTKIVKIADSEAKDGYQELEVKVWNDTVANLSLMALGTSAPEIMLSVVEIIKNRFESKELGPSTIVGSAAFNLFCITAVCIVSIPTGEGRKISAIKVYGVTSFFSIFSYIWLILVIMVISPEVVELWEAILTFLMFPLLIVTAYAADKDPCCRKNTRTVSMEIGLGSDLKAPQPNGNLNRRRSSVCHGSAEIIELAKELGKRHDISEEDAAMLAAAKVSEHASHTSNWYRINATRMLVGGVRIKPKVNEKLKPLYESLSPMDSLDYRASRTSLSGVDMSEGGTRAVVEFTAASCAVLENEGKVRLGVRRYGNISDAVSVRVETIDGTAEAGSDYKPIKSVIKFAAKEQLTEMFVEIIDDDIWEPDEFFFVKLSIDPSSESVVLGKTSINQITIINDDEPGKFEFTKPSYLVKESSGKCVVVVQRVNGGDGKVTVSWKTVDMSAKSGTDFGGGCGLLMFEHGETSKEIEIPVYPSTLEERDQSFQIELMKPTDGSQIGKISRTIVTIVNDDEFNSMVARIANLAVRNLDTLKLDTASWAEQFRAALNVNGGDLDNAGFVDYIMHFSTFFWKVIFAFVPPPSYAGGWLTFIISLALIGALTTIIGDLATVFGCLLDVPDSITAITFVALGTSMPDTFASRAAALNEKTADSSIGNINGSNSVNVFLGLGLPWLIASIYWNAQGQVFRVPVGSLGFSVILYTSAAVVAIMILMIRRRLHIFGKSELGGPKCPKIVSALLIFSLWLIYVIMASLQATKIINVSF